MYQKTGIMWNEQSGACCLIVLKFILRNVSNQIFPFKLVWLWGKLFPVWGYQPSLQYIFKLMLACVWQIFCLFVGKLEHWQKKKKKTSSLIWKCSEQCQVNHLFESRTKEAPNNTIDEKWPLLNFSAKQWMSLLAEWLLRPHWRPPANKVWFFIPLEKNS